MSTKTILAVLLVASLAGNASFLITTLFKRPAQHAGGIEQLELTADQTEKFEGFKQAFLEERGQVHQRLAELRSVLADEFAMETPDRQRLVTTAVEMAQVQTGMRPKLIDYLLALHALLTPAQRASFVNLMRTGDESGSVCPGAVFCHPSHDKVKGDPGR